ncbi:MAG: glycosyltransferase [Candidatus Heimdallarchaeota archaeon]|nr:glycosyltransferase [Candidatus Heimdallarchaeota archaeon]
MQDDDSIKSSYSKRRTISPLTSSDKISLDSKPQSLEDTAIDRGENYQEAIVSLDEKKPAKEKKVIITIPAYNESKTIEKVVSNILKVMNNTQYKDSFSVIVVDDGSTDQTAETARNAGAQVFSHPRNYGLAATFRTEMDLCLKLGADIIVHADADGQYQAEEIPLLLEELDNGNDLVLGSRFMGKIEYMPWLKKFGNKAFSRVLTRITGVKITDGQTGFRAFTREVAESIQLTSTHTYTQEQIIRAAKKKFHIKEVPIYFAKREDGNSRLMRNPFGYAIRAWINIIRFYRDYSPIRFFGGLGMVLFVCGLLTGGFLISNIFYPLVQDPSSIIVLMIAFLFFGFHTIVLGFVADMMKKN